jgi:transcriptional regulator with XRE-family HTH domain
MSEIKVKHNNLRLLRLLHGDLPQKYVASKIGISQAAYSKMEKGQLQPSKKIMINLSDLYKNNVSEFIFLPQEEVNDRFLGMNSDADYSLIDELILSANNIKMKIRIGVNRALR